MAITVDRDFLLDTLVDLVRINSVNPVLVSDGAGEAEIAPYTAETMRGIGLQVAAYEPQPGRVSVVGTLPGRGTGHGSRFWEGVDANMHMGHVLAQAALIYC